MPHRLRDGAGPAKRGFLGLRGDWRYLWIDATYLKVRRGGRIVSFAPAIVLEPTTHNGSLIAVGVNTDGRRENLDLEIGTSKAEPIWTELPRAS